MRKYTLTLAAVLVAGFAFAQDLTSKKGEPYLPEAGEYAISIDASPFLTYFGNFLGSGTNNAPVFQPHPIQMGGGELMPSFAIRGKMFKDANTAYRGTLRIGLNNTRTTMFLEDADGEFEDVMKTNDFGIMLGGGLEKRMGNTRLQGLYGGEALIGLQSFGSSNEFGRSLEDSGAGARTLETKSGSSVMFGLNGFVGVEYFFAPKISVGGEYTWGLMIQSQGRGETITEEFDDNGNAAEVTTEGTSSNGSFSLDTGVNGMASLFMNFHF